MFPISITLWLRKKKRKARLNRAILKIYFTRRKKVIDEIEEMDDIRLGIRGVGMGALKLGIGDRKWGLV
jgi:hypothetical protein